MKGVAHDHARPLDAHRSCRPWPEFQELSDALSAHLLAITDRIIREEVFAETRDADEISEPGLLR